MPTYQFLNTQTGEEFEVLMKISEREEYLKNNPHIQTVLSAPALVSGVSTSNSRTGRVPSGFNEVLSKVAEAHPTSKVAQKHGRKSIKQIKTEQIVKKHLG
jgi:predicted nucleic acid-binding Zn ribbon protein